jgi:hypothetical protein
MPRSRSFRFVKRIERFGLLLDREWNLCQHRKQIRRMRAPHFRKTAVAVDLALGARRGLDRGKVLIYDAWLRHPLSEV